MTINPTAAILIIGNEILSGRTQDKNVNFLAIHLLHLGISLKEVRIVPDEEDDIIEAINSLCSRYSYVFTTGGIGATHDDITSRSIAKAFKVPLEENQEALSILKAHYPETEFNESHHRMALMPKGVTLIENIVTHAPGFQIENVFVLAGIPVVMQSMFQMLSQKLERGEQIHQHIITCDLQEGDIAKDLENIQNEFVNISIGSYPFFKGNGWGVSFLLQTRDNDQMLLALTRIRRMIDSYFGMITLDEKVG